MMIKIFILGVFAIFAVAQTRWSVITWTDLITKLAMIVWAVFGIVIAVRI